MYTLFTSSFNIGIYVAQLSIVLFPIAMLHLEPRDLGIGGSIYHPVLKKSWLLCLPPPLNSINYCAHSTLNIRVVGVLSVFWWLYLLKELLQWLVW